MANYDSRTALVVVDMQNDFAHPSGSLYVRDGEHLVAPMNVEIVAARAAGALVVYTQDWHPESTPHFAKDGGVWPVHCVGDTWGAEFIEGLRVDGPVVRKGVDGRDGYSGFTVRDPESGEQDATDLAPLLRERDITRVVIAGLATDYCVVETALDAVRLGFETVVAGDLIGAVDLQPGDGERALVRIRDAGATVL